jgi:two-component system sensor histidine kinase RegB
MQGDGVLGPTTLTAVQERLNLTTLVRFRWLLLAGETVLLLLARLWARADLHYASCIALIAVAAAFNLLFSLDSRGRRVTGDWAFAVQIGFNIIQGAALLLLTGGVLNPLSVILIAPATHAAATFKGRQALALGGLTWLAVAIITVWSPTLGWAWDLPREAMARRLIAGAALALGVGVTAGIVFRAATAAARMELALNVTQTVLAREQRLSALGGLAAAAAHELGTPLATILVVAKEMAREAQDGPVRDDADLLVSQAERCREILRRLTDEPDTDDAIHARMTLLQFANEVIAAHLDAPVRVEAVVVGPPGARPPEIRRMPEVLHAMTSLVENAVDFAESEVLVSVRFDDAQVSVEVRDDGPGFSSEVLGRLGQPYVTSRPGGEGSRSGRGGMGLGFFIAKTLLERTGAAVEFRNGRRGGAIVAARWVRATIEAPPIPGGFALGAIDFDAAATEAPKGA